MKRDHRVPLCGRALAILAAARTLGDGPLVFPSRSDRRLAVPQLRLLLARGGIACVPHGFRSSFRDWAAEETDHPREVVEAALAHRVQNPVATAPVTPRIRTCFSHDGIHGSCMDFLAADA